jgi:hypothetical protein
VTRKDMLADIDKIQTAIGDFIHHADDYILRVDYDTYNVEGEAIRQIQGRLARLTIDLSNLYRRLDS